MKVELLSIGDELLIGQTVNTNASYLGRHLTAIGLDVRWVSTVGDEPGDLKAAVSLAMGRSDVLVTTGGLGPTHDDITKKVIADFFGSDFEMNLEVLAAVKERFARRGIRMAHINEEQAMVPRKAEVFPNPVGTAPGLIFEQNGKKCFVLPGVPAEMRAMCEATVFPILKEYGHTFLQKTIRTSGIAESTLFEKLGDIDVIEKFAKVAFLPKSAGVDIRLITRGDSHDQCQTALDQALALVTQKVGDHIYGFDDEELVDVVARKLIESGKTVAVAESCTGGLLSHTLTNISGSSAYFERGVVSYSNAAKMGLLKVPRQLIEESGAVSARTAEAMAEGVKEISGADFGLSTTGIAGPTGGTEDKPVGLVFIGVATATRTHSRKYIFAKDRVGNKARSVQAALKLLDTELQRPAN